MLQTIAQTIVSCLKSAHARAAVREPPGRLIGCCFHLVATFLFDDFHDMHHENGQGKSVLFE